MNVWDDSDLKKLGLSARAFNCLCRGKIFTIAALLECPDEQLMMIRNMGVKTLQEIRAKQEAYLQRVEAGEAEPPMDDQAAKLVDYRSGAEAMRQAVLLRLWQMQTREKGAQKALLDLVRRMVLQLEVP